MKKYDGYTSLSEFEIDKEEFLRNPNDDLRLLVITSKLNNTESEMKKEIAYELIEIALSAGDTLGATLAANKFIEKGLMVVQNSLEFH